MAVVSVPDHQNEISPLGSPPFTVTSWKLLSLKSFQVTVQVPLFCQIPYWPSAGAAVFPAKA